MIDTGELADKLADNVVMVAGASTATGLSAAFWHIAPEIIAGLIVAVLMVVRVAIDTRVRHWHAARAHRRALARERANRRAHRVAKSRRVSGECV
jgi:hypothetical protein